MPRIRDSWFQPLTVKQVDAIVDCLNRNFHPFTLADAYRISEDEVRRISREDNRCTRIWGPL